jgi:hypothetical protein
MSNRTFQKKLKKNGKPNPKYVDVLTVDPPIAGQAWGVFSFISPEKILKQKNMFFFEQFLKQWEMSKSMEKFIQFLSFVSYKYKLNFEDLSKDFEEFVKDERESIVNSTIEPDYLNFLDKYEDELTKKFDIQHEFQTSVRAVKNRGNYATQEEAELRAKLLRESDPIFDIHVGPIGTWNYFDPDPNKTSRTDYMEEELNELVHRKKENEELAKAAFDKRILESKQKAIEDNKKNAEKYGNIVTQDIDEEGNLIGTSANTIEQSFVTNDEIVSDKEIQQLLFEGEEIIVGKSDYGQSLLKSGPFANK